MKFDNQKPTAEKIEIHSQKQIEKQKVLFTSTTKFKGHTMFEINCSTGEINPAQYKNERIEFVAKVDLITGIKNGVLPQTIKDIDCKENCLYISALNEKSARKKYMKWIMQRIGEKAASK